MKKLIYVLLSFISINYAMDMYEREQFLIEAIQYNNEASPVRPFNQRCFHLTNITNVVGAIITLAAERDPRFPMVRSGKEFKALKRLKLLLNNSSKEKIVANLNFISKVDNDDVQEIYKEFLSKITGN